MELETLLKALTPEIYQRMSAAVETGKWPDGTSLTTEQRDSAQQAVMLYQSRHNHDAEHMTVDQSGEIKFKSKVELKRDFGFDEAESQVPSQQEIVRVGHDKL
ncbi:YeaC family protein [Photobacterium nomapromontoriensis]|uniref:YeaC family protein n=1 Tax=Photobacterium nomapromontoriensis TaxID=2910237 RepID=UPI003D12B957